MRNSSFWWILIGFMVLLDFYFFQGIKVVSQSSKSKNQSYHRYHILGRFNCCYRDIVNTSLSAIRAPGKSFSNDHFCHHRRFIFRKGYWLCIPVGG